MRSWRRAPALTVAVMLAASVVGCSPASPVAKVCMSTAYTIGFEGGAVSKRCVCVDGILHSKLSPEDYQALSKSAQTYLDGRRMEAGAGLATRAAALWGKKGTADTAVHVAELALVITIAADRCP